MGEAEHFRVRFWGVRGSYPTPGPQTIRHGGNTTCLEVQAGTHTLILDAGSGIIGLGAELIRRSNHRPLQLSLFITHGHGDHLAGFPFFAPLFEREATIDFFGPRLEGRTIEELVTPIMSPPYFPIDMRRLPSHRTFHTITEKEHVIWRYGEKYPVLTNGLEDARKAELRVFSQFTHSHPQNGAAMYRIEYAGRKLVFATDVEWGTDVDPVFIAFAKEADLLIHDAQYTNEDYTRTTHGYGHSTVEMATEAATAAQVRELVLFHHDPGYDDDKLDQMEAYARQRFASTRSAYEGMEIDLLTVKNERG